MYEKAKQWGCSSRKERWDSVPDPAKGLFPLESHHFASRREGLVYEFCPPICESGGTLRNHPADGPDHQQTPAPRPRMHEGAAAPSYAIVSPGFAGRAGSFQAACRLKTFLSRPEGRAAERNAICIAFERVDFVDMLNHPADGPASNQRCGSTLIGGVKSLFFHSDRDSPCHARISKQGVGQDL